MGQALPFSQIDTYLSGLQSDVQGCIVDTQFLVAIIYPLHKFNVDADFLFKKLAQYEVPIFTTVTTRSEFIDIQRRIIITEALMNMLNPPSEWEGTVKGKKEDTEATWRLTSAVKTELRKHKAWIDGQASKEDIPILPDKRIKDCKEIFFPTTRSGKSGWLEICEHYLGGKLLEYWDFLVEKVGINYLDMGDKNIDQFFTDKVTWKKMYQISEHTCLGSSDSMILNMLNCSKFSFCISADYDMAFSVISSENDKIIFIPDNLYSKKIKKIHLNR